MVKMIKKNAKKNAELFYCEKCDFACSKLSDWNRHLLRRKHQNDKNDNKMVKKNAEKNADGQRPSFVCECGKVYQFQSGLSRHKKTRGCVVDDDDNELKMLTNLVFEVVKQNKELIVQQYESQKHNEHLTNKIVEIYKAGTQINNTNNTFNLNVFLNETCKDAMNIMDFVDSVKLQLSDLEDVGKLGFVDGISNIIVKNLKALDVTERPIHCADKKREIIYVKDENKWEKDNDQKLKIRRAIKQIAYKNERLLSQFKEKYPCCNHSESLYSDQYNKLVIEAMGGNDNIYENENKIIKKISKEVIIDKQNDSFK